MLYEILDERPLSTMNCEAWKEPNPFLRVEKLRPRSTVGVRQTWSVEMSTKSQHLQREQAKLAPESQFESPTAVLAAAGLSDDEKRSILERWADQVDRRLASGSEGMPTNGTEPRDGELLREIGLALEKLEGIEPNR